MLDAPTQGSSSKEALKLVHDLSHTFICISQAITPLCCLDRILAPQWPEGLPGQL